jgi:hypothetical protein
VTAMVFTCFLLFSHDDDLQREIVVYFTGYTNRVCQKSTA